MSKPHIISLADFEGYKIEKDLASSSSEKKRLTVEVTLDGEAVFKVTSENGVTGLHSTLKDAIRDYNSL